MNLFSAEMMEIIVALGIAAALAAAVSLGLLVTAGLLLRVFDWFWRRALRLVPQRWAQGYEDASRSLDLASLVGSLLVAFCCDRLAWVLGAWTGSRVAATAFAAFGVLAGGFFACGGARRVDPRRSGVYGVLLAALIAAPWLIGRLLGQGDPSPATGPGPAGPMDSGWLAILLVVPLALAGGLLQVWLETWSRARCPRRQWEFETRDGTKVAALGPWRDPVLAWVWFGLAGFLLLTCWVPLLAPGYSLNILTWAYLGLACAVQGRRRIASDAGEVLAADPRPPIVYLRSFNDDGRMPGGGLWEQLVNATRTMTAYTLEQRIGRACRKLGPFVAIGRPGETLPELGAARMYVSDDDWQTVVDDLLHRAGGVVLQAGDTHGLEWELGKTGDVVAPANVVVFIPFRSYSKVPFVSGLAARRREARYRAFRALAGANLPAALPERIGTAYFLYFDPSTGWTARVLKAFARINPAHPLRAGLRKLSSDWVFMLLGPVLNLLVIVCVLSMALALTLPAVQAAREAAHHSQSTNNLKLMGLAAHNYASQYGAFPLGADVGRDGTPHHGFQARMLPFLEQEALYHAINFNVPWDSAANTTATYIPLGTFLRPGVAKQADGRGFALSHYAGSAALFQDNRVVRISDLTQGSSNTVMMGEVANDFAPWAHPSNRRDPSLPINSGPKAFGSAPRGRNSAPLILWADGSVGTARGPTLGDGR